MIVIVGLVSLALLRTADTRDRYSRIVFGFALATAAFICAINGLRPRGGTLPLRTPFFNVFMSLALLNINN